VTIEGERTGEFRGRRMASSARHRSRDLISRQPPGQRLASSSATSRFVSPARSAAQRTDTTQLNVPSRVVIPIWNVRSHMS